MAVSLTAILKLSATAFHAGIARAQTAVKGLANVGKTLGRSFSGMGKALALGGIYGAIRGISEQMDKIRASGDFTLISEGELRKLENARETVTGMRDAMMGVLARGGAKVIGWMTGSKDTGPSFAEIEDAQSKTEEAAKLRQEIRELEAAKTDSLDDDKKALEFQKQMLEAEARRGKSQLEKLRIQKQILEVEAKIAAITQKEADAAERAEKARESAFSEMTETAESRAAVLARREERKRQAEFDAMTRSTASGRAIMLKRELANLQASSNQMRKRSSALGEDAATYAELALSPSARASRRRGLRDLTQLQKLAEKGGRKLMEGRRLSEAEMFAVQAVSAKKQKSVTDTLLEKVELNTKAIVDKLDAMGAG